MRTVIKTLTTKIADIQERITDVKFKMDNWDFEFAAELTFYEDDLQGLNQLLIEYQNAVEMLNAMDYKQFKEWHIGRLKQK
jgi:hypothetical protein